MQAAATPTPSGPTLLATIEHGFALLQQMQAGHALGDMLGVSLESQESLYAMAFLSYRQARYADAQRMFAYLMALNHADRRFHMGFAACMQMQHRYGEACRFYSMASLLDLTDPQPVMHCAECQLALGLREQARSSLEYAVVQARAREAHQDLVPRLEAMLEFLDAKKENAHE